jgi:heptosyltransferase-1
LKRILIIRLSAIGDVVMASGLIPALQSLWPDSRLSWLAEPAGASLLRENPHLDQVLVWPRAEWASLWRQRHYRHWGRRVSEFMGSLRAQRFDLAIDAQGLLKSALWARASGAARRIGIGSREGSGRLMTEVLEPRRDDPRIGSEYRQLAEHLGAATERFRMDLPVSNETVASTRALLTDVGLEGPYIAFAPFTTRPQKHWFEDRWSALALRLAAELGLPGLMLGGPESREAGARISAAAEGRLTDLVGRTTLPQSVAVIAGSQLLIGVDTGLTHMGIARGVPTLALFGSTRPYLETPYAGAQVLYEPLICSPCRRHPTCAGTFTCMRLHTVEKVATAATALLETA